MTEAEWEASSLAHAAGTVAVVQGGRVVAAAGYVPLGGAVVNIGVLTDPASRDRGLSARLATEVVQDAHCADLVPQWQTLETNGPAMAVGSRLGFVRFATTIAGRLD